MMDIKKRLLGVAGAIFGVTLAMSFSEFYLGLTHGIYTRRLIVEKEEIEENIVSYWQSSLFQPSRMEVYGEEELEFVFEDYIMGDGNLENNLNDRIVFFYAGEDSVVIGGDDFEKTELDSLINYANKKHFSILDKIDTRNYDSGKKHPLRSYLEEKF